MASNPVKSIIRSTGVEDGWSLGVQENGSDGAENRRREWVSNSSGVMYVAGERVCQEQRGASSKPVQAGLSSPNVHWLPLDHLVFADSISGICSSSVVIAWETNIRDVELVGPSLLPSVLRPECLMWKKSLGSGEGLQIQYHHHPSSSFIVSGMGRTNPSESPKKEERVLLH